MKWAIFIVGLMGLVPLIYVLRSNKLKQPWVWIVLGFFPCMLSAVPNLNLSAIAWPWWPGIVQGFQITALDLYAFAIFVTLPRQRHPVPFRLSMLFYFSAVVLSVILAQVSFAAVFYAWQLVRVYLLYVVVTRACADERNVLYILTGMAAGICLEASMAMWERFSSGAVQAAGSFVHQNTLGLLSHFTILPFFALLLAGQRGWLPKITTLAGPVIWILTASRAALGLGGLGLVALFTVSALHKWTATKARVLLFGALALAVLIPAGMSSLDARFAEKPLNDYDERVLLENMSGMMLSDKPWGFGANNFAVAANTNDYYDKASVAWTSRNANVHNIYWLTAAETGYLGLAALVVCLLHPLFVAFRYGWRSRGPRSDLLLGLGMALLIVYIHSYFEWYLVHYLGEYLLAMSMGMIAGLATQLGYGRPRGQTRRSIKDPRPVSSPQVEKASSSVGDPVFRNF